MDVRLLNRRAVRCAYRTDLPKKNAVA